MANPVIAAKNIAAYQQVLREQLKALSKEKAKTKRVEEKGTKEPVKAVSARRIPCLPCVKSVAHGRGDGICTNHNGQGGRCTHCTAGDTCHELPKVLLPFARRMIRARTGDVLALEKARHA